MEPNKERQLNDKKAERLAKIRERRRQRMLEETAEERETRLENEEKRGKKGRQKRKVRKKEYQKIYYRWQKETTEGAKNRETLLAKRREHGKKGLQKLKVSKKSMIDSIIMIKCKTRLKTNEQTGYKREKKTEHQKQLMSVQKYFKFCKQLSTHQLQVKMTKNGRFRKCMAVHRLFLCIKDREQKVRLSKTQ